MRPLHGRVSRSALLGGAVALFDDGLSLRLGMLLYEVLMLASIEETMRPLSASPEGSALERTV